MQIKHLKAVVAPADGIAKISAAAWSPNNQKLAVANADRIIQVFDENGERKDKFSTKGADPQNPKGYTIVALAFSPDSTKLAVAQSDGAVFVYRLGLEWGEKKSICNKFIQSTDVTALAWPKDQHGLIVFGMADGKVKLGNLKTNKAATLYQGEGYVTSLASSLDGNAIVSSHANGAVIKFSFDDGQGSSSQAIIVTHTSVPVALAWTLSSIVVVDLDKVVTFYGVDGKVQQQFDYGRDPTQGDLTVAVVGPTGQSLLLGSLDKVHIFNFQAARQQWIEAPSFPLPSYHSVTAMAWKPDGSKVVLGSLTGSVDMFDCCLKKTRYKGTFEFTYVSPSQVLVKRLATGARILLKSAYGSAFTKINIFQDQFLVAHTEHTLCLGDLGACRLSEIQWQSGGNERFHFAYPGVCMVFNAGELLLVEYGLNDIIASCRTEFMSPHLLSVRLNERNSGSRTLAYLIDSHTVHIMDLARPANVVVVHHDAKVDWLELSGKANKLLFRDKKKQLHLFDVATQQSVTLLAYCTYVQWVPNSDVVVAQSRTNLCVWYGINSPDRVTMHPIKGDVLDIVRESGVTNVVVDEGLTTATYTLDEGLIEFGTAMDDLDWLRALTLLEALEITPETEAMWTTLSAVAVQHRKLALAERCFAALGDMAKAQYLRQVTDLAEQLQRMDPTLIDPTMHFQVRAKLAVMDKEFKSAERIYLEQGQVQAAMDMYQELHKWDASIKVAELAHHPEVDTLRRNYFTWLVESGQEEGAAEFREASGDYVAAIQLYLQASMPSRAAVLLKQHRLLGNLELVERTAHALAQANLWEKAGDFYGVLGQQEKALVAYERGNCFKAAIDLCRTYDPARVVQLEEKWGDYLVSTRQVEAAIHHYIEGNQNLKALETAIAAKSWTKATSIADSLDASDATVKKLCTDLAQHFLATQDWAKAEKYFIKAGRALDAVDMYNAQSQWDKAHRLAAMVLPAEDVYHLYTQHAQDREAQGKHHEAEKLYLLIGEPDLAINMYKNAKNYDKMIELVAVYHKDLLNETHVFLGKTLEAAQNFKQAEHHYVQAGDWKSAVNMYCSNNVYEDAHRVAKLHGGAFAAKQVAYLWARSLGGEAGAKLLIKHGLLEYAIDFAAENAAFDFAFELCKWLKASTPGAQQNALHPKESDVYLKQAMFYEDEGKFADAEAAFVAAQKPKEAILMHIHNEDWDAAQRVAEQHDPSAVVDVQCGRAKMLFTRGEYAAAESLWLRAQRPEAALNAYKAAGQWAEAMRFAREYVPAKVAALAAEHDGYLRDKADASRDELLSAARLLEQQGDAVRAAETYLRLSPAVSAPGAKDLSPEEAAFLVAHWTRAAELAHKFAPSRATAVQIARQAAAKLADAPPAGAGRTDAAGDVLVLAEQYKDAADMYARAALWDKCKQLGRIQPALQSHIDALYVAHLKRQGAADALAAIDVDAACQVHAQKGNWEACLAAAAQNANADRGALLQRYLMLFANQMLMGAQPNPEALLKVLAQYGAPTTPAFVDMYAALCAKVLADDGSIAMVQAVRDLLKKIVAVQGGASFPPEFTAYLVVAHLQFMRKYCEQKLTSGAAASGGAPLAQYRAMHAVSLLRYRELPIPIDRALFQAGMACQAAAGTSASSTDPPSPMARLAFALLNRFLDVAEAIEDAAADTSVPTTEWIAQLNAPGTPGAEIAPVFALPPAPAVNDEDRERARDWVLAWSVQRRTSAAEPDRRACEACGTKVAASALACGACRATCEPCIVTGFPVLKNATRCGGCGMAANKDDWNRFVVQEKQCPWCLTPQGPSYSLRG
ncbi:hypothetical protein GGF31_008780 [Allomyces arbusculus]|nr:hypothetical protein GGF31_008780 [Allomyces arbusculus]